MEKIMNMGPCYSRWKIEKIFAGRKWLSHRTIARLNISLNDRLWVLIKLMPEKQCREFARKCALDVIHLWNAPDIVIRYLETGDEEIREAAREAASAAVRPEFADLAWDSAIASAFSASQAGSWEAARDAWASARAAARATANQISLSIPEAAPWDVVWAEAMEKYIVWCVEYLDMQCFWRSLCVR
jgi:hypothetical protein